MVGDGTLGLWSVRPLVGSDVQPKRVLPFGLMPCGAVASLGKLILALVETTLATNLENVRNRAALCWNGSCIFRGRVGCV